eukprot:2213061-Lingulodinium_polyedra.AAC.1
MAATGCPTAARTASDQLRCFRLCVLGQCDVPADLAVVAAGGGPHGERPAALLRALRPRAVRRARRPR